MKQRKPITAENALVRLESLCARSEHCTYEMETKLRAWGISSGDADKILKKLTENRFVDDERFARAFVNDKFRFSGYGRMKIRAGLMAKRIDRQIIEDAMSVIDAVEYRERLEHLLVGRMSRIDDTGTYEGRTRLYRYGVSRGYESALVAEVMREILRRER